MNKDHIYWKKRVKKHGEKSVADLNEKKGLYDDEIRKNVFFSLIKSVKGKKVLDVGCGTGKWDVLLAQKGAEVTGIDFVEGLIDAAAIKADSMGVNVRFKTGDIADLIPGDELYDLVISITVLQHITDEENMKKALANIHSVLKTGGQILIIEYAPKKSSHLQSSYMVFRTRDEWVKLFNKSGFVLIKEKGVRILGFRLYDMFMHDLILKLSLFIDRVLSSIGIISNNYCDTRLMVFRKN